MVTKLRQWWQVIASRRLELISFVTGFGLLSYELAAARVLAPSIGSSTYVWTSVIGIIIAALSLGFFVGGRLADARGKLWDVAWLLLMAAVMVGFTLIAYESLLSLVIDWFDDRRLQAVAAALLLFAPASFLIGVTSPYLAKLKVSSLKATGRSVASLDAFNAIGGIVGTFVTGFILFGYIGSHETIALVAILLLAASWLLAWRHRTGLRLVLSGLLLFVVFIPASSAGVIIVDTPTANYKIVEGLYDGRPVTGLVTGPSGTQSAVYQDGDDTPVFWYTGEMARLVRERNPDAILMLGGGAFTLSQHLAKQLPDTHIDVVEIDPELQDISEQYFNYHNPANVSLIFDDARTFVNETKKRYDMILVDVYGDGDIPFSLMTKEYGSAVGEHLKPEGLLAVNLIAGTTGPCKEVFSAVHAAYASGLAYGQYQAQPGSDSRRSNNIVLYAHEPLVQPGYQDIPVRTPNAYTDEFAPAERLYYDCQQVR